TAISSSPEAPQTMSEVQKVVDDDEDDEWGDFGEAVVAAAPIQNTNPPPTVPPLQMASNDEDDDDWGAFDQARPSTDRSDGPSQLAHQQSLEDWGAFEETQKTSTTNDDNEDDEWQAEFSSASTASTVIPAENLKTLEEMLEDDAFWDDGYCEAMELEEISENDSSSSSPLDIPALFDTEELKELTNEFEDLEKAKYSKLWLSLRVIEEAISQEQKTSTSPAVDSPSVPAVDFDWDTSGLTNPMNRASKQLHEMSQKCRRFVCRATTDCINLLKCNLLLASFNPYNTKTMQIRSVVNALTHRFPNLWKPFSRNFGYKEAYQCSAIIDVDFLGSNGVATAYTSTLQQDLEQFGLTNGSTKSNSNGSSILENLMSRANDSSSTTGRYRTPEVLSLDARQLLERLPDLQYLQSEVLMFPVGTNLPH
ncbi:LOW QUALITY PROTEIN: Protein CBG01438, partial [Caenorhabditis briggsae]